MTKAQSLSVQTLIIVALGIIVLIIGIVMYTNYTDLFKEDVNRCENQLGSCYANECPQGTIPRDIECPGGEKCCMGLS